MYFFSSKNTKKLHFGDSIFLKKKRQKDNYYNNNINLGVTINMAIEWFVI